MAKTVVDKRTEELRRQDREDLLYVIKALGVIALCCAVACGIASGIAQAWLGGVFS